MKVQRLITTLSASIDRFVGSIENHEAVADALLNNLAEAAARISIELASNTTRQQRLEAAAAAADNDIERWQDRALAVHDEDPKKALACVQKLEAAEQRRRSLAERLEAAVQLGQELAGSLAEVEAELERARSQAQALAARTARADARSAMDSTRVNREFAGLMDRWERSVLSREYRHCATSVPDTDPLGVEFERDERIDALRERLASLVLARGAAS